MKEAIIFVAVTIAAAPAFAGHNNPWTDDLSILNQQFHDTNQLQSLDTPGEDEMRGEMERNASGKLESGLGGPGSGGWGQGESTGSGGGNGGGGRR